MSKSNNKGKPYVSDNAQLMKEWDWEKNNELKLTPETLTLGSDKKYGGSVSMGTNGKQE